MALEKLGVENKKFKVEIKINQMRTKIPTAWVILSGVELLDEGGTNSSKSKNRRFAGIYHKNSLSFYKKSYFLIYRAYP